MTMSKYCPILERRVVYLTCEDCDDKGKCTEEPSSERKIIGKGVNEHEKRNNR